MFGSIGEYFTGWNVLWGSLIFVGPAVLSLGAVILLMVLMPADYFQDGYRGKRVYRHPLAHTALLIGKNLLGIIVVIAGIVLLAMPGQGSLTILIGVMLLNFPGKRRLERWLVSRKSVFRTINAIRRRFGRPPLVLDGETAAAAVQESS